MTGDIKEAVRYLKKTLGVKLTEIILKTDAKTINRWLKDDDLHPSQRQENIILAAQGIIEILMDYLDTDEAKWWLVEHSEYLYGVPAIEISRRPDDVKYAALNRVVRGEVIEPWLPE